MFIGHFAVGFASKRLAPRTSLAILVAAPILLDMIWPVLVLAGVERARIVSGATVHVPMVFDFYPYSHSLAASILWGALLGGAVWLCSRDRLAGLVVGAGVVSHWVLDWITHAPDMPLYPGGPAFGLSLWNSIFGTVLVEGAMFAAGVWLYTSFTRPRGRAGSIAWWSLVGLLALAYGSDFFSPPPPSITAVAVVGSIAGVVTIAWAWLIERNRQVRGLS